MEAQHNEQEYQELDVNSIFRDLLKNTWLIAIIVLTAFMITYVVVNETYTPQYETKSMVGVSSKATAYNVSDSQASAEATQVFAKAIQSQLLESKIKEILGVEDLLAQITCETQTGSNIAVVKVSATHPKTAYEVITLVLKNYQEVSQYLFTNLVVDIIEPAVLPDELSNGTKPLKMALFVAFVVLVLLLGVISIMSFIKDTIKNEQQLEHKVDAKLFATLYYEKSKEQRKYLIFKVKNKAAVLITNPITSFSYVENLRKLRMRLFRRLDKKSYKSLMISSVLENEGKSTVASNIALSMALESHRTVLIDGDLRRPALHKVFEKDMKGIKTLSDYLKGNASFKELLQHDEKSGLYVIYSGRSNNDSTNLVSSEKMRTLIEQAKKEMDYVVIDTPPIALLADAEAIADYVDAALLVVKQDHAWASDINDAVDVLKRNQCELLGCVFNSVKRHVLNLNVSDGYGGFQMPNAYNKGKASYYYDVRKSENRGGDR